MGIKWRLAILPICFFSFALQALQRDCHRVDDAAPGSNWSALKSSMETMHVALTAITSSGQTDVDFVRLMLPHHRAAIDMAKTQLLHGTDPQIRRLAQEIIADQQSEIELMELWLKQHEAKTK